MANLREIKKRIGSVSTTQQITRTMEMVATAKIARALQRAKNSEPYSAAITDVMLTVATDPALNVNSPLLVDPETYERALVIAISSDRGLAGGFNMQVERAAEQRIKHFHRHGAKEVELITCGRKVTEYFRKYPREVMGIVGESDDPTLENARVVANYVIDGFSRGSLRSRGHRLLPCEEPRGAGAALRAHPAVGR
ncbi:MAG: F0F1 ATP synthase subunit gamma [Collinsella sp.]